MLKMRKFLPLFAFVAVFVLANSCEKNVEEPLGLQEEVNPTDVNPTDVNQGGFLGLVGARNQEGSNSESGTATEEDCFTLNYPITILFPDGSTQQVNNDEELDALIEMWFVNNEGAEAYPEIQFPIAVTLADGSTQTIDDDDALCDLFYECYGGDEDEEGEEEEEEDEEDCFDLVYPITITGPDGDVTINNDDELDAFFENLAEEVEITFVYPIDVVLEDSTSVTLNNDGELEALYEECYGNYDDGGEDDFNLQDCFTPVYPISFTLADGTVSTVNSEEELFALFESLGEEDDLEVNYPVDVVLAADGSTVTVNNDDELDAIIDGCE